ncbi:MAG: HAD family phosphatase [Anaerolineae bacterium]
MISAVIFDVGGVLIRTEDFASRRNLEKRLGMQPGESEELVFSGTVGTAAQLGKITAAELWTWVGRQLSLNEAELARFRAEFFGRDRLNRPLLDYVHSLRPRYQTAIISNFMDDLHEVIEQAYPIAPAFDLVVGSAYEGVMKPDAEIFERTLERLNCRPEQAVFVDDFAHNVAGARAVGLHAVHFTPQTDVPAEFAKLGIV